jgi:four helix bundle protein
MTGVRNYKELAVWPRSMELAQALYVASERLREVERFGLTAQLRRGVVSVPSNIAEGYGRQSTGDHRQHFSIATGSLLEVETRLLLCERLGYLKHDETSPLLDEVEQIAKMLAALIATLH